MASALDLLELGGGRKTPYIAQTEASECALACLAMIAGYHGYKTDIGALRQRYALSLKGATLKQLSAIAESVGFNVRSLRGEMDDLPHLALPAVLHWNLNHFVVLTRCKGHVFHIHDPARGPLKLSRDAVSRHWTGVAVECHKSESFRPVNEARRLKITQLWSSMHGLWPSLGQILTLSIILQLVALASPFYMQVAIDTVFPSFDHGLLAMLAMGFAGVALISFATSWLRATVLVTLNSALSYQVVVNLFRHLARLPLSWFEKRHVGDVVSRFGSTQPISQLLAEGMITAFIDGGMALVTLGLMLVYSPVLAGLSAGALTLYILLRLSFLQALKHLNIDAITRSAHENSVFMETIRGISAIKAFGQEGNRQRVWQQAKADAVNANIRLGRMSAGFDAANQLVMGLENVLFVYLAIGMALDAKLTVGMIFAFQSYKRQFLDAGTRLVEQAINFRLLDVHLGRISDIALSPTEKLDQGMRDAIGLDGTRSSPHIELRNVHFSYGMGEKEILKGVSLVVEPGDVLVLVGPSGGGKTTLLKIMMGLIKPTYGEVLIDGQPIEAFGLARWRRMIGSVAQDDVLFAGNLAENISFFDPEADFDRIRRAAKAACIADDIEHMPMQYETLVGDMGSTLSGGQRQRLLLARALYAEPVVLFSDEGTAHLDPENEAAVAEALSHLPITRCSVAHRPGAAIGATRILIVANGQLHEPTIEPQLAEAGKKG